MLWVTRDRDGVGCYGIWQEIEPGASPDRKENGEFDADPNCCYPMAHFHPDDWETLFGQGAAVLAPGVSRRVESISGWIITEVFAHHGGGETDTEGDHDGENN